MQIVEEHVIEYLTTEKNIPKSDISSTAFIANLRGDMNWMVGVDIKEDDKVYYYYESDGEIILESSSKRIE